MLIQKIFIASPGDVCDERNLARQVIDRVGNERAFRERFKLQIIAWDQPGAGVPMNAGMTPQQAIEQGLPKPSECNVVIVIFWSRIGTLLPPEYVKADGSRYLSGTEWEFDDAYKAFKQNSLAKGKANPQHLTEPQIWLYRRAKPPAVSLDDPEFDEKQSQYKKLKAFFATLKNADGAIKCGVNDYDSPDQFQHLLEQHLRDHLTQLLETLTPTKSTADTQYGDNAKPPLWEGSPYPGLETFTPVQAPIYFGRGRETDQLVELMRQNIRFVAVVGASGSGKSSLVSAGLLPRLQHGALPSSTCWLYERMTPSEGKDNPVLALAAALKRLGFEPGLRDSDLAPILSADNAYLAANLPKLLADKSPEAELLLFVDQFEEAFGPSISESKRQAFIALLISAAAQPRFRLVLTLRADFYDRALEYERLAECLCGNGTFTLAAPGLGALHEMIEGPARIAGLQLEAGLADMILDDTGTGPGVLPLMAFALSELYRETKGSNSLTLEQYIAIGRVQGAIAKRAKDALNDMGADVGRVLDTIFPHLVDINPQGLATRKWAAMKVFDNDVSALNLIAKLVDARLLVGAQDERQVAQVEIAHETLLESWPQLRDWIKLHRDALSARNDLEAAAEAWRRSGKPRWSGLPSGSILKRYRRAATIPDTAKEFLNACRFLVRVRIAAIGFVALCFVAVVSFQIFTERYDISSKAGMGVLLASLGYYGFAEPEMVYIPAGGFIMGANDKDPDAAYFEKPSHWVEVKAFKIGKYEVTFDQYDIYRVIVDRPKPAEAGWGRDDRPVINVSWEDATAYAAWLKEKTGKSYRLPTEAEWEYAARGNKKPQTRYPWGDDLGKNNANCNGCGSEWDKKMTAPVGSFKFNGFKLYDMAGNVYEWVADCWHEDNKDAPERAFPAWEEANGGDCVRRVQRGGSWFYPPRSVHSASRNWFYADDRSYSLGFRLAQD